MKKIIFIVFILCLNSAFCFSAVPKWLVNLEKEFPSESYIRAVGEGNSESTAKKTALAELSAYFSQSIDSKTFAKNSKNQKDLEYHSNSSFNQNITVVSKTELFAVHYTQSYFDKKVKKYIICAYIQKDEAYNIISEKLEFYEQSFFQQVKFEKTETDELKKIIILNNALLNESEINSLYNYAIVLNYQKAQKFKVFINRILESKNKVFVIKQQNPIEIDLNGNFAEQIKIKLSKILTENGFIVSEKASYKIKAQTLLNVIEQNGIFSAVSSIFVTLTKNDDIISSFSNSFEKKSAYNEQTAKKMALTNLEDFLQKEFIQKCFF